METKKTTRLGFLSGNEKKSNDYRFDFVEPCFESMDWFFEAHAEWLDTETDSSYEEFTYAGHGIYDQRTIKATEIVPTLKLGSSTVDQFLNDGDSLEKYYNYAWKYLKLDKLILHFVDDLQEKDTLNIVTVPDKVGAVTWDAVALLYHLYEKHEDRWKCLELAMERAGEAITTRSLILACADTLKHRGA